MTGGLSVGKLALRGGKSVACAHGIAAVTRRPGNGLWRTAWIGCTEVPSRTFFRHPTQDRSLPAAPGGTCLAGGGIICRHVPSSGKGRVPTSGKGHANHSADERVSFPHWLVGEPSAPRALPSVENPFAFKAAWIVP